MSKNTTYPTLKIETVLYRLVNGVVQYQHRTGAWREAMVQNWDWYLQKAYGNRRVM